MFATCQNFVATLSMILIGFTRMTCFEIKFSEAFMKSVQISRKNII